MLEPIVITFKGTYKRRHVRDLKAGTGKIMAKVREKLDVHPAAAALRDKGSELQVVYVIVTRAPKTTETT